MVQKSKEKGQPFGLRLPEAMILEFKQEALRRNITASALFKEVWQDFQGRSK